MKCIKEGEKFVINAPKSGPINYLEKLVDILDAPQNLKMEIQKLVVVFYI